MPLVWLIVLPGLHWRPMHDVANDRRLPDTESILISKELALTHQRVVWHPEMLDLCRRQLDILERATGRDVCLRDCEGQVLCGSESGIGLWHDIAVDCGQGDNPRLVVACLGLGLGGKCSDELADGLLLMACDSLGQLIGRSGLTPMHHSLSDAGPDAMELLQNYIDSFHEHIWIKDTSGVYRICNISASLSWGKPLAEIVGKSDDELNPDNADSFVRTDAEAIRRGVPIVVAECVDRDLHKGRIWLETTKAPMLDRDGRLLGIIGITRDIARYKAAEEQLLLARRVFENSVEGVMITDRHGKISEINGAFFDITGYSREEVIGKNPRMLSSGRHEKAFFAKMWQSLLTDGQWHGEIWNRRKDGNLFPQQIRISAVYGDNEEVQYFVAVFSDISRQKQSEAELAHMAYHDPLTRLPNRIKLATVMEQQLRTALHHGQQLALVLIDVDLFKHINDSFGHLIGDEVLLELSKRLDDSVSSEDMLARIGGDEFVLLCNIDNNEDASLAVSRLKRAFEQPFRVSTGDELRLTASMGIATFPNDGGDPDTLLRNADAAMYRAKQEGRNSHAFYTEQLTKASVVQLRMQSALYGALASNAFHLVYQPKVDLSSRKAMGFEALIRWHDPLLGFVSPAVFIPIAESAGLIHEIGLWVLRQACMQGRRWLDAGYEIGRIGVNVAGPQLHRPGFVEEVQQVLRDTGFPAACLELEITESMMMQEPEQVIDTLKRLGDLGIMLAVDDFGTGYSSLNYLKKLPIHILKIDQSFVRDLPDDSDNGAIAGAIIAMGQALRLQVIAEGVETEAQARFLSALGCQQAQGYLFAKPAAAEELGAFLNPSPAAAGQKTVTNAGKDR
ncbi:EAL domain-containing protein [Shewanella sedimentimangrovi]|uniref:EAL domain-containing protein n=1 Tax=Shewanella sedimentimangrovi TaxID=2814293 RepID=A0ABX7R002_9GAMM|nr:EAL domain-containing protein [Shewanella sedimentimangrovi]